MSKSCPCFTCDGHCCKELHVPVNGADLLRLHNGVPGTISDWCAMEPLSEGLQGYATFGFHLYPDERFFLLCLKRLEGVCVFANFQKHGEACMAHAWRPGVCRSYPISFNSGNPRQTPGCLCPQPWQLSEADELAFSKVFHQYNADFAEFKEFLRIWERTLRPPLLQAKKLSGNQSQDAALFFTALQKALFPR